MSFDQIMIHYSAPTLCGIKPANLFSIKKAVFSKMSFKKWQTVFDTHGISAIAARISAGNVVVLVYNARLLEQVLNNPVAHSYLAEKGYKNCSDLYAVVKKMINHMKRGKNFPHEIGVILGYPVEDVIAFEKHKGRECKFCGCWKAYSNVENAKQCQCRYRMCSCMCKQLFDEGYTIHQIVKEYKKAVKAA